MGLMLLARMVALALLLSLGQIKEETRTPQIVAFSQ